MIATLNPSLSDWGRLQIKNNKNKRKYSLLLKLSMHIHGTHVKCKDIDILTSILYLSINNRLFVSPLNFRIIVMGDVFALGYQRHIPLKVLDTCFMRNELI